MHDRHRPYADDLRRRVLDGPGSLDVPVRRSLATGDGVPADLASFAATVRDSAYAIGDGHLNALTTAGYSGDQIYEATLSVALGAGMLRLDAGMRVVEESFAAAPTVEVTVVEPAEAPAGEPGPIGPITVVADDSAPPLARRRPGVNIPEQLR